MMKHVKPKKRKLDDKKILLQSSSAEYPETEHFSSKTKGKGEKTKRKNKKGLPTPVEEVKAFQSIVDQVNSMEGILDPLKKKKKKKLALQNIAMEAVQISSKKERKRKKSLGSLEMEKRTEGTEIEADTGETKGSRKRKPLTVQMEEKIKNQTENLMVTDRNMVNKSSSGRRSADKTTSGTSKRKKKKLKVPESKSNENISAAAAGEVNGARKTNKKSRLDRSIDPGKKNKSDEIEEISDVDGDHSRGMKKWFSEYWNRRPGLTILQQRIDEFMVAHEAREEQARKEREALAAEGGWTVVVRQKGKKKTTDTETGITVGSVAPASVQDNAAKKKKEIPLDFYRFQKREAKRNEVMSLQSRFEQDKKRIQQLRAARKFRPY